MNGPETIQSALRGTKFLLETYVSDLSDADLLVRPAPGANHLAWQIGHLISAEPHLVLPQLPDVPYPELPAGFDEAYSSESAGIDDPSRFLSKAEYLRLFDAARTATIEAVGRLTDADLDRPTAGRMAQVAPRLGDLLLLVSNHTLMHGGQATVVRRKLGKPVLI